jgi:hypothetical protein
MPQMNEYHETAEEKAFDTLLEKKRDELTAAARELVRLAVDCACRYHLQTYAFQPPELYAAQHNILHLAYELTRHDREVLAKVAQAARAAIQPLDKDVFETPTGYRVCFSDLDCFYAMISRLVEQALTLTDRHEIDAAQIQLWTDYGKWVRRAAEAESRVAQRPSDEGEWEVSF